MNTYELYDGAVKLEYGQKGRQKGYFLDGQKVLRVTEIAPPVPFTAAAMYGAKCAAEKWGELFMARAAQGDLSVDEFDEIAGLLRKAPLDTTERDRGTEGHALIESYFRGQNSFVPDTLKAHWEHFITWAGQHAFVPWHLEQKVFSRIFGYAGTLDFAGEVDGWPTMIDWKFTGPDAKKRESYPIQTAAYVQAYAEEHGHEPPAAYKRLTLAISENGVKEHWAEEFKPDFEAFKHLLAYYRWSKNLPQFGDSE